MTELILIRGVPGSGKSTMAAGLTGFVHIEEDQYFTRDGVYTFDPEMSDDALAWAIDQVSRNLADGKSVVVSNVFAKVKDLWPYVDLASRLSVTYRIMHASGNWPNSKGLTPEQVEQIRATFEPVDEQTFDEVTQAQLARMLGVKRQAIHDLIKRGILHPNTRGLLNIHQARRAIANNVRPDSATSKALMAPPPPPPAAPATAPAPMQATPDAAVNFHVYKTMREGEEARIAKIKRQQLEGTLTEADPAAKAVFDAFRGLRDSMMPLGRRVSAQVANMTDPREIQLLIDEGQRECLRTFHDRTLAALAARISPTTVLPTDTGEESEA